MARDLNRWTGIGRLGKDIELRYLPNGDAVANFSIACSDSYTKDGNKVEKTEWVNLVAFKKLAEICGQYLHKGSKVYVEGSLRTRKWEKDGVDRYTTEIMVNDMQMLDGKQEGGRPAQAAKPAQKAGAPAQAPFVDDDLPF